MAYTSSQYNKYWYSKLLAYTHSIITLFHCFFNLNLKKQWESVFYSVAASSHFYIIVPWLHLLFEMMIVSMCYLPLLQESCTADSSVGAPPLTTKSGGDSETSEAVGPDSCQATQVQPSPAKSPQHHTSLNSSPQPNDTIPTDLSDTTESEPDSKVTCKIFNSYFPHTLVLGLL